MKQFFLPVLIWTLAISQQFAQNIYPAPMQQRIEKLPLPVRNMLDKAGINTVSRHSAANRLQNPSPLQLDSTKTFTGYALSGGLDSVPETRSVFEYPEPNREVQIDAQFINGNWTPVTRVSTTLDANKRPTESLSEIFDANSETWLPETWTFIEYHVNSSILIDSLLVLEWNGGIDVWELAFKTKNIYDAQDRILSAHTTFNLNGEEALFVQEYGYDANHDNHLIETFLVNSGFMFPFSKQELQYADHRLIQSIDYMAGGIGVFEPSTRTTFAYNTVHLISQENVYQYVSGVNDWSPAQTLLFEYDNQSRVTVSDVITHNPNLPDQKQRTTHAYIQNEKLALESTLFWDPVQNLFILADRTFYYYSGGVTSVKPLPNAVESLSIAPNPALLSIRLSIGSEASVQVLDMSGHLLLSSQMMPGESLDLTTLPAGIYMVTALESGKAYAGKLMKL